MASSSSAIFSGQSSFSADFQQVLSRAVAIASLPIQSMQTDVAKLQAEQQALSGLGNRFTAFGTAMQSVSAGAKGNVSAISSQPLAVAASTTTAALAGTYSIEVVTTGSSTSTLSHAGATVVADPSASGTASTGSYTLTLNGTAHTITPTDGTLISLSNAINAAGVGVHATVVNVGANATPDYRLAITSDHLGAETVQLNDGSSDMLDTLSTGSNATYKVNGGSTVLESNTTEITLSPGLTVRLLQPTTSGQPATIRVASDYSSLKSALSDFASAYNAAVDSINAQRGSNAGVLRGQSTVSSLTRILQGISQYTSTSGGIRNLTDLGINLDRSGHLAFDSSVFANDNIVAVQQFLGSSTSGFIKSATDALNTVSDATSGLIQTESLALATHVSIINQQIAQTQSRIDDMQNNLQERLTQADAAIATLQAQKTFFTNLFAATFLNNNSNGTGSNG